MLLIFFKGFLRIFNIFFPLQEEHHSVTQQVGSAFMVTYKQNKNMQRNLLLLKKLIKLRNYSQMQEGSSVLELIKKVNKEITSSAYVFNISFI